jgi:hypothetical protein
MQHQPFDCDRTKEISHAWITTRFLEELRKATTLNDSIVHASYRRTEWREANEGSGTARRLPAAG